MASAVVLLVVGHGASATLSATTAAPAAKATTRSGPPVLTLPRPEDFVDGVRHRYFPLAPGTRWVYKSVTSDGTERIRVKVLEETKLIEGITATVVRDRASLDGTLIEDILDWYAQDRLGNVWHLGEDTTSYEPGQPPSKAGSWQTGSTEPRRVWRCPLRRLWWCRTTRSSRPEGPSPSGPS